MTQAQSRLIGEREDVTGTRRVRHLVGHRVLAATDHSNDVPSGMIEVHPMLGEDLSREPG